MRSRGEVELVLRLARAGHNHCEIARETGIPRRTVQNWVSGRVPGHAGYRRASSGCLRCRNDRHPLSSLLDPCYAYLLGLYLGDGCLLRHPRAYRLNIALDAAYPLIIAEAEAAMTLVMPASKTSVRPHRANNYVELNSYSQHWPCLFPQRGPGMKHTRHIALEGWQQEICDRYPHRLLRGLIHSDGCRSLNTVRTARKTYAYPRYQFSNRSDDIRAIFCEYCDKVGVQWRRMNRWTISIARRESVARLDAFIGPKR
jgi:hypothetical protein